MSRTSRPSSTTVFFFPNGTDSFVTDELMTALTAEVTKSQKLPDNFLRGWTKLEEFDFTPLGPYLKSIGDYCLADCSSLKRVRGLEQCSALRKVGSEFLSTSSGASTTRLNSFLVSTGGAPLPRCLQELRSKRGAAVVPPQRPIYRDDVSPTSALPTILGIGVIVLFVAVLAVPRLRSWVEDASSSSSPFSSLHSDRSATFSTVHPMGSSSSLVRMLDVAAHPSSRPVTAVHVSTASSIHSLYDELCPSTLVQQQRLYCVTVTQPITSVDQLKALLQRRKSGPSLLTLWIVPEPLIAGPALDAIKEVVEQNTLRNQVVVSDSSARSMFLLVTQEGQDRRWLLDKHTHRTVHIFQSVTA